MSVGIQIGGSIQIGGAINIGDSVAGGPTVATQGIWSFDPAFVGPNLILSNSNFTVEAGNPETSIALGQMDGSGSLYDYGAKVMYTVQITTEDPADVTADLAHIGFAYQYVDLNSALGDDVSGYGVGWCQNGEAHYAGSAYTSGLPTYGPGDYLDMAVNLDTGLFWVRVNGGLWNGNPSADPATGANGVSLVINGTGIAGSGSAMYPAVNPGAYNFIDAMEVSRFTYSIPAGFVAL
jgi:hypothetical protein